MGASSRPAIVSDRLVRLRRRLTAWYAGTFLVILLLLALGMFAAITRLFDKQLDESLRTTAGTVVRMAQARGPLHTLEDVFITERTLSITDTNGASLAGAPIEEWASQLARTAWQQQKATAHSHDGGNDRILRAVAQPSRTSVSGVPFVAVALADEVELEDRYGSLIALFTGCAILAAILVAIGGWVVAGQSMAPVERTFAHMRRFMADAAHELRTPLTITRSRAEVVLQRARSNEEYVAALAAIERDTERLGGIVEDLLTLARADAGERPIARQRIFLDDVTLDAAQAARVMADGKPVALEIEEFEEAPITGDEALIRQLVLIFLDNAIKYTLPNGTVRIGVTASAGAAVLVVTDNGMGIPADQLPHVFERFFRGDPARQRTSGNVSEGAGLGLSIAQWIVQEHHAHVDIDSAPGTGTRIRVEFPLDRSRELPA